MCMNRYVNIGLSCATAAYAAAVATGLSAQTPPAQGGQTAKPATQTDTAKPATQKPMTKPAPQPQTSKPTMEQQSAQAGGAVNLGTVRIPRAVKAGGESLAAGSYQLRVT